MRHKGNRSKPLDELQLPAVEKVTARYSKLGGAHPKDKQLSPQQLDAIWAGAGVKKRKGEKRR